jgi:hypothetical protein
MASSMSMPQELPGNDCHAPRELHAASSVGLLGRTWDTTAVVSPGSAMYELDGTRTAYSELGPENVARY